MERLVRRLLRLAAGFSVLFGILYACGVPYPLPEKVKPDVLLLARADSGRLEFYERLRDRLLESGGVQSVGCLVPARRRGEFLEIDGAPLTRIRGGTSLRAALGGTRRRPLIVLASKEDLAEADIAVGEDAAVSDGFRHGLLWLELAEPRAASPAADLVIVGATDTGTSVQIAVKGEVRGDTELHLELGADWLNPEARWNGISLPVHADRSRTGKAWAWVDLTSAVRAAGPGGRIIEIELCRLHPSRIRRLSLNEGRSTNRRPPEDVRSQAPRPRGLLVSLAAFAPAEPQAAWETHLRACIGPHGLLSYGPDGFVLGDFMAAPATPCDILLSEEMIRADDFGRGGGVLGTSSIDFAAYDRFVIDLSWPVGLTPAAGPRTPLGNGQASVPDSEYYSALNSDEFRKLIGGIVGACRRRPVHILVLGVSELLNEPWVKAHPLQEVVREVEGGTTLGSMVDAGGTRPQLVVLFDQSESAGNTLRYAEARLRSLPPMPLSLDPAATVKNSRGERNEAAAHYLDHLRAYPPTRGAGERETVRRSAGLDSKAAVSAAVASDVALWATHPLLRFEIQGRSLFSVSPSGGTDPPPNRLREIGADSISTSTDSILESLELEEMLMYLRREDDGAGDSRPRPQLRESVALLLYDADDVGLDAQAAVREGGVPKTWGAAELWSDAGGPTPRGCAVGFTVAGPTRIDVGDLSKLARKETREPGGRGGLRQSGNLPAAFLFGGRTRLSRAASAELSSSLRGVAAEGVIPRPGFELTADGRSLLREDRYKSHCDLSLRICSAASLRVAPGGGFQPFLHALGKNGPTAAGLCGRTMNGSVVSLLGVDYALELSVYGQSLEAGAAEFDDWVLPDDDEPSRGFAPDESGALLRVSTASRSLGQLEYDFQRYPVAPGGFPVLPSETGNSLGGQVRVQLRLLDSQGNPLFPAGGEWLAADGMLNRGTLRLSGDDFGGIQAGLVEAKISLPGGDRYTAYLPFSPNSEGDEYLRSDSCVSTSIRLWLDYVGGVIGHRVRPQNVVRAVGDGEIEGVAISAGPAPTRTVIPRRLITPFEGGAASRTKPSTGRPQAVAEWFGQRIEEIFTARTSRGWCILSLLFGAIALLLRIWGRAV